MPADPPIAASTRKVQKLHSSWLSAQPIEPTT